MNAIIIEDEKNSAEVLKLLVNRHCKSVNIISVEHTSESAIKSIINLKPDLIFIDIEMPTCTGFDIINATKNMNYEIIFTTAYEQYAIKALKTHAVDYLLKPIDVDELITAINNTQQKIESKSGSNNRVENLLNKMASTSKKISISTNEGIIFVNVYDIIYLESDSNYTHIFLKDGSKILISKTLKSMEDRLKEYDFCRVHYTYLVNLNEIDRYIKGDGGTLILKNKISISVSRTHKQELLNKIGL